MRYSVTSPDYEYTLAAVASVNAKATREARNCNQVFCELTENQAKLLRNKGMVVEPIKSVFATQVDIPKTVQPSGTGPFSGADIAYAAAVEEVRNILSPPLKGVGQGIAILDSGIRMTHLGFGDRIIYSKNFSDSPTAGDILSHGTSVAWLAAGGVGDDGLEQGMAPEAAILNIKVLNDNGEGTEESVILGVDHVLGLDEKPQTVNLSLGAPDGGNPDNPLRMACRAAYEQGIQVLTAAGNGGPSSKTILCPATEPTVFAIGSLEPTTFKVCTHSSRGPTLEGLIKPDMMFYGDDLRLASSESDTSYSVVAGTSFAVGGASGISALAKETIARLLGQEISIPGIPHTYLLREELDWVWEHIKEVCAKPEGVPVEKDNTYGWGMPLGSLILESFRPLVVYGGTLETVTTLMLMGMFVGIIKSMTRRPS